MFKVKFWSNVTPSVLMVSEKGTGEGLHSSDIRHTGNYWSWRGDYTNIIHDLHAIDWERQFYNCDANRMWLVFMENLQVVVKKHAPLPRSSRRRKKNTWLSKCKGTLKKIKLECGPMPNVIVALPNIGDALCSTPQSLADAHYLTAVQ